MTKHTPYFPIKASQLQLFTASLFTPPMGVDQQAGMFRSFFTFNLEHFQLHIQWGSYKLHWY